MARRKKTELKPCPFCGGTATIAVCDEEGNMHDSSYESDPWSGLRYVIRHTCEDNPDCPIATYGCDGGVIGTYLYYTRKDAAEGWNTRT